MLNLCQHQFAQGPSYRLYALMRILIRCDKNECRPAAKACYFIGQNTQAGADYELPHGHSTPTPQTDSDVHFQDHVLWHSVAKSGLTRERHVRSGVLSLRAKSGR
jgi:hypothetical protein